MPSTIRLAVVAGILALGACSGDSITETTGDRLAADEALAVLAEVSEILGGAILGVSAPPPSSAVPVSETFSTSQSCPLGGSVSLSGRISGDVDPSGDSGDFNIDFIETIDRCGVRHETTQFVVDGDPDLKYSGRLSIRIAGSAFTWNGTLDLRGGFSWVASDGRSGSCGVAVTYRYAGTSVSYTGTVCGQPVNGSITVGF